MVERAMKEAVRLGLFPKRSSQEFYLKLWDGMRKVLDAAING